MGVTEEDWRFLANESFDKLDLTIAHKAYSRVKDYRALDVIHQVQVLITILLQITSFQLTGND